jgi:hypothetical protein
VSLDIPFHLKKKSWGWLRASGSRYGKAIYVKNKNRPVSGFFTKIAYFQVMNFIPVKLSSLYNKVNSFMKRTSTGYKPKKSRVFPDGSS